MKRLFERLRRMEGLKLNIKFTLVTICFVVIPVAILGIILFRNMENSVVSENMARMQYTMERNRDNIQTGIDSINMTTQFFLSDDMLKAQLRGALTGEEVTTSDLIRFYDTDIAPLERLVSNNPLLYGVRVYAVNDNIQEMVPILYSRSRMQKLEWASDEKFSGWYYDYSDEIFSNLATESGDKIVSLITPITDYGYGTIGTVEAAMTMKNMFPVLCDEIENEWGCFVSDDGNLYFGDNQKNYSEQLITEEISGVKKDGDIYCYYRKNSYGKQLISYLYVREIGGTLFCVQDISGNMQQIYQMRNTFMLVMVGLVILLAFFINFTVKLFVAPVL